MPVTGRSKISARSHCCLGKSPVLLASAMHRSRCHIALQGYSPVNTTVFSILRGPAAADSAIMRCLQQQLNSIPSLLGAAPWQARPMRCNCFKRSCVRVKASLSVSGGDGEADVPGIVEYVSNSRKQLWLAAIKPPMYSVGIVPVLVSSSTSSVAMTLTHKGHHAMLLFVTQLNPDNSYALPPGQVAGSLAICIARWGRFCRLL